jgi:nitronate monooxygenase
VAAASSRDTIHTEAFSINWPPRSPVRVIPNSLTEADDPPPRDERRQVAEEDGRPIYAYSTDSPVRTTTGDLEKLAHFAGQSCGLLDDVPSAGERIDRIVCGAQHAIARLQYRERRDVGLAGR